MADIYNKETGGINRCWHMVKYNAKAVQEAIARDASIGRQEARLIHALLKGPGRTAPLNCSYCPGWRATITLHPDDTTGAT